MTIRSITIRNLLGISALELSIGPSGALIEGGNGRGKTSVMRALKAGLDGAGISADAVRKGESAAEILIDLDHESVRRRITAAGKTTLDVEDANGVPRKRPAEFLSALLGLALLDPLDLYLAKPGERRAQILRAVPCTLTPDMVNAVLPEWHDNVTAEDCEGHGIEALAAIRENVAGYRTAMSRRVKDAKEEHQRAEARMQEAARLIAGAEALDVDTAQARLAAAAGACAGLAASKAAAAKGEATAAHQRAKADALRASAADVRAEAPALPTEAETRAAREALEDANVALSQVRDRLAAQQALVRELEQRLAAERATLATITADATAITESADVAAEVQANLDRRTARRSEAMRRADDLEHQAAELLETLAAFTSTAPTTEELARADADHAAAVEAVRRAQEVGRLTDVHLAACATAAEKKSTADTIAAKHAQLDAAVKALTDDLPAQLLAGAGEALHGLTFDGDRVLVRDGHGQTVSLDTLNTAQQMAFALGVAKRLNTKSRILLVDGLERIDDEQRTAFVRLAIEDGFQLFATRVTSGPLKVSPIEGASS